MSPKFYSSFQRIGAALVVLSLAGCVGWQQSRRAQGTSVMQYLYPDDTTLVIEENIPELHLPLRVGVAFVPPSANVTGGYAFHSSASGPPTEQQRAALVETVAARFRALPYIGKVEHIPSAYLRSGGGFANLDQIKSMFGVDVIALVAYDQVQFTDQNILSLAYWTVIGAYVVNGEHNDTQTLLDAVVYDISSRSLLFRAPGTSQVKAGSTAVGLETKLRADSALGFKLATDDMVKNLETQLASFRTRIKESPEQVRIVHRPGYTGAGSFGYAFALLTAAGVFVLGRRPRA